MRIRVTDKQKSEGFARLLQMEIGLGLGLELGLIVRVEG